MACNEQKEEQTKQRIYDMWMRCHTQEEISKQVGVSQSEVASFLRKLSESYYKNDSDNFRNFEAEIYTTWNFSKATNEAHRRASPVDKLS